MTNNEPSDWSHLTIFEKECALKSRRDAVEYINSLGKTDLINFSKEEFETLLLVICNSMIKNSTRF